VVEDSVPPVITLNGLNPMRVGQNESFTDPGARVTDNEDSERTIYGSGTVNPAVLGTYTLTYTASDVAGNAATPVTRTVVVGSSPDTWLPPGEELTPPLLTRYAIGGASSPTGTSVPPSVGVQTQGAGEPTLTLTVLVRTDDLQLVVQAEAVTSLGNFGNTGQTTTVSGTPAADQSGVPAGFQRQVFTTPANAPRQFIRLKVTR